MPDPQDLTTQDLILELQETLAKRQVVVTAAQQWSAGRIRSADLLEVVGEYEKEAAQLCFVDEKLVGLPAAEMSPPSRDEDGIIHY